ncbi:alpha/beta hydrolase [Emcibacter sp.]|uniref:alpha/beta hydrolase n=1 Tax=Emcibacter sp. TaxID=1979954 RepID=UPI003A8E3DCE
MTIELAAQGSFYFGFDHITAPGEFDVSDLRSNAGDIFPIHQGYVRFQIPAKSRKYPMVMVHGAGQTGKTYENSRDREGYESIFLRRGWSVYIPDFTTRGRASTTTFSGSFGDLLGKQVGPPTTQRYGNKHLFTGFRFGNWTDGEPQFFPNVQFPQSRVELDQFCAQSVPFDLAAPTGSTAADAVDTVSDNLSALMDEVGPAILITHSQSGPFGWHTRIKNSNVKAIVSYEPISFVFPDQDLPAGENGIPAEEFAKLTQIPIQMVFGDYISAEGNHWQRVWHKNLQRARLFADTINRHGGDAQVVHLPEVGIQGNTHFPFADLNNDQIADLLSRFLQEQALDTYDLQNL